MKKSIINILPFPEGKDFAVSFVDDTDLSTIENTAPVYELLHSLNIMGTKTVWISRQKRTSAFRDKEEHSINFITNTGSTLEDENYCDFVKSLKIKGYEIALHGIAAGNSYRDEIIEGIDIFKSIFGDYPKINIFHERNRENLYAGNDKLELWPFKLLEKMVDNSDYQGHKDGSKYFWGDIAKAKIKYMRLPFHTISEVNTSKVNPSMPFHDPKRPYVNYWFASSDGADCQRFIRLLSDSNIKRLEKENGVCLIYTHFAKGFCSKKNGRYALNREFVDTISNLGRYPNRWCPTASELLDRLLVCKNISIRQARGEVFVQNKGNDDIKSLALKVASDILLTEKNDTTSISIVPGKVIIANLPAGETVVLRSNQSGYISSEEKDLSLISRRERIIIEIANYYGLLIQKLLN
jgi:hypothetical protein